MRPEKTQLNTLLIEVGSGDSEKLRRKLDRAGFVCNADQIDDAEQFASALDRFAPDLVICNSVLRRLTCLQVVELVKERRPSTPLIVVTNQDDANTRESFLQAGTAAVVSMQNLDELGPAVVRGLLNALRSTAPAVEDGHDAAFAIAPDGRLLYVNPRACTSLGYSRQEILAMTISDIDTTMSGGGWSERWDELGRRKHLVMQSVLRTKDGQHQPAFVSITHHATGDREHAIAVAREMTDRNAVEEAIRISEQALRRAQKMAHLGSWTFDLNSMMAHASDEARRIYGLSTREWTIEEVQQMPLPEYRRMLDAALDNLLTSGRPYDVEFRIRRPSDGAIIDIHSIAEYDAENNLVIGTLQDVTASKQAQRDLQESEERHRLLFERNLAGVYRTNIDGRILDCNDALASILGFATREEVLQEEVRAFYPDARQREQFLTSLGETNELRNFEVELKRRDQTPCWCLINCVLMRDENGHPTIIEGTMIDITERKEIEEQRIRAELTESIGMLAGGVAHEFNNLLQAIAGLAQGLRRSESNRKPTAETIDELENLVERGGHLTRQLLVFSHGQTFERRLLNLNQVVETSCRLFRKSMLANIELELEFNDGVLHVEADQGQLEQLVLNLSMNAQEAMPDGGRLVIRGRRVDSQWLALEFEDDGHGMTNHVRSKMFEPFFSSKATDHGSGLGLAVVDGVVKRLGGRVEVETEVGQGTMIRVLLPMPVTDVLSDDCTADWAANTGHTGERILVVDDERLVREGVAEMLIAMGFVIETAASVATAKKIWSESRFDLLLTDMVLPDGSGNELIKHASSLDPPVPAVIMTGYSPESLNLENKDAPVLVKPFGFAKLNEYVRKALDNGDRIKSD